jgi:hypothetical protein
VVILLVRSAAAGTPAEEAARKLAWIIESPRSVELEVRTRIIEHVPLNPDGGPQEWDVSLERYIETATGQRLLEYQGYKEKVLRTRNTSYSDGTRFAHVDHDPDRPERQHQAFVMRRFWQEDRSDRRHLPVPWIFLYVGREPLHKALPHAEALGEARVLGRPCEAFLFSRVRWLITQDQVFYLDRETGLALKVESYRQPEDRARERPLWVWTAESIDTLQGYPLTRDSTQVSYGPEGQRLTTWEHRVESIAFDRDYPASTFWPTLEPGVTLYDGITGKIQTPTTPGLESPARLGDSKTGSQPVVAEPGTRWITASGVFLGAGCLILVLAGLIWMRKG